MSWRYEWTWENCSITRAVPGYAAFDPKLPPSSPSYTVTWWCVLLYNHGADGWRAEYWNGRNSKWAHESFPPEMTLEEVMATSQATFLLNYQRHMPPSPLEAKI